MSRSAEFPARRAAGRLARALILVTCGILVAPSAILAHDGPVATAPPAERDEWILLSRRVHGGFGSLIALGIRIGDDALKQLGASQRELDVTYFTGERAPCPCVVDGILISTQSSPGQASLRVAGELAPTGEFGRALIRHKTSGRQLVYAMPGSVGPIMAEINKLPSIERWNAVMQLADDQIFIRTEAPAPQK